MKRREFIMLIGGTAAAWPLAARAQQTALPTIGLLSADSSSLTSRLNAFRTGLAETGLIEGRNVALEYRFAESNGDRLPALLSELLRARPAVIAAWGLPAALAAKAATNTIPIAFYVGVDPVEMGLVASLNRPGANLTGVSGLSVELVPKRLELLHELVPTASTIALLVNPTNPNSIRQTREVQAAAHMLGLELHILHASNEHEFGTAFAELERRKAGALVLGADGFFIRRTAELAALTERHRIPTIFQDREFAVAGGLASYGASYTDAYRLFGTYAGRLLKGEKPAELPVQQATKVELVINMQTAKALGLDVSLPLLGRADEVIE
jgi:putative tryptophan/tyrosine transport system substrate-binding protein